MTSIEHHGPHIEGDPIQSEEATCDKNIQVIYLTLLTLERGQQKITPLTDTYSFTK